MKLISKINKGDAIITQENKIVKYEYVIFNNLSVLILFNTDKKTLKINIKAGKFERQLMFIKFNNE